MYLDYFGLDSPPFGITPDTSLFFDGAERGNVLEAMLYALSTGEGIIKIVGEVGSGKTMLSRMLSKQIPDNVVLVFLLNPSIKAEQVLYAIAYDLGLEVDSQTPSIRALHILQEKLLELYQQGKKVVLVIDEAQQMPLETLEEIRLLSNLETETEKLLQIILFGQPELDQHLDTANIRQLRERIAYSFYLTPLSKQTTEQYLNFRLAKSGHQGRTIFKPSAIKLLTNYSDGTLRRLNMLAEKSLLAAFLDKKPVVSSKHVRTALKDNIKGQTKKPASTAVFIIAAICLLGIALTFFWLNQRDHSTTSTAKITPTSAPAIEPAIAQTPAPEEFILESPPASGSRPENKNSDLLNERTAAFLNWDRQNGNRYTIRLLTATRNDRAAVEWFLQTVQQEAEINQVYVTSPSTDISAQRGEYIVYYGAFVGYSEAASNLSSLPDSLKHSGPYISKIPQ